MKPTNKQAGDRFEQQIAEALKLAGFRVSAEQLVEHAKVDLLARRTHFGREHTVAVECRNAQRPLSRADVVSIWADWEPLIEHGAVDEVLIVAANGLAPSATTYVKGRRGLESQLPEELLAASVDFESYLTSLRDEYTYALDGLADYYLPPTDINGMDLETTVRRWISDSEDSAVPPTRPIAILGAYGLGKSSFATHLAASFAEERMRDLTARIPILVRLHELIGEQSLEGLLGKHFTATHDAPGYSFSKLMKLNRAGHLVVIFDGFDEMRQLLSWREFRHNLRELNRLCVDNARVIILGRPTAFETDEQQRLGLHGEIQNRNGQLKRDPSWPDYYEIELAALSEAECKTFLKRYLDARSDAPLDDEEFEALWWSVNSHALRDIARRPVQLRMLAEILPDYTGDTDQLDVVKLYDLFVDDLIDRVIGREEEKQSRLAYSSEDRRLFLRRFAFWLWTTQSTEQVTTEELPDELIAPFVHDGRDIEATRRDLVVGSPLDRRAGERIRFPHRSFQEFLVAEELWDRVTSRIAADSGATPRVQATAIVKDADRAVSREVADFMTMLRSQQHEMAARKLLVSYEGSMSLRLVESLYFGPRIVSEIHEKFSDSTGSVRPWELVVLALWTKRHDMGAAFHEKCDAFSVAHQDPADHLAALFCLLLAGGSGAASVRVAVRILRRLLTGSQQVERIGSMSYGGGYPGELEREEFPEPPERAVRWRSGNGRHRREERQTGGTIESRRIVPVGNDFVIAGRDGQDRTIRVGLCVGRARLRPLGVSRYRLTGGPELHVRWLPEWGAEFLSLLEFRSKGRVLHFDRLHTLFERVLAPVAFTREWSATVDLGGRLDVTTQLDLAQERGDWIEDAMAVQALVRRRQRAAQR